MQNGIVKWFNVGKGFGFIGLTSGERDIFIHANALQKAGIATLAEGQLVTFDIVAGRDGRDSAENVKLAA